MFTEILKSYGIEQDCSHISEIGSGLINNTWRVDTPNEIYILQRINDNVFKQPKLIDQNISAIAMYLSENHPKYVFPLLIPNLVGETLVHNVNGYYRLFQYIRDSLCFDTIDNTKLAYEAARQFGCFTSHLTYFPIGTLKDTIPDFHNLPLRYSQYLTAAATCSDPQRLEAAKLAMQFILDHNSIVQFYEEEILGNPFVIKRVCHHDTKLSNVLFNHAHEGVCVIDLDTVMAGYFISDLGDMLRTYICAESEEAVVHLPHHFSTAPPYQRIRLDFFRAVVSGYLCNMSVHLTAFEKGLVLYAGKYMIYMQAVRFLADYLSGDTYYKVKHPRHNLDRAENQLLLLKEYCALHAPLQEIVDLALA